MEENKIEPVEEIISTLQRAIDDCSAIIKEHDLEKRLETVENLRLTEGKLIEKARQEYSKKGDDGYKNSILYYYLALKSIQDDEFGSAYIMYNKDKILEIHLDINHISLSLMP